jgi:hypothetical protein
VWENLREQIHVRGDGLIGQHASKGGTGFSEIPRAQQLVGRPALETIVTTPEDAASVAEATLDHEVTLNKIASRVGVRCRGETPGATARDQAKRNRMMCHCKPPLPGDRVPTLLLWGPVICRPGASRPLLPSADARE